MKTKLILLSLFAATSVFAATPEPTPHSKFDDAMADMITKATQTAGQAKDFLVEQTPDVIRQLLYWKAAESIAYDVMALLFLFGGVYATRSFIKWMKTTKADFEYDVGPVFGSIGWGCGCVGLYLVALCNFSLVWLQIWLAPKVYLIEYARHLVS